MLAAARGVNGAALSMRGLGAAIKTIPFAALVSFLVTVLPMLYDFVSGLFESAEASSALGKATEEANKQITEERGKMETLFQQLKRTNAGTFERQKLIDEINGTYGTTLKNLSDEEAFTLQVANAYDILNKQMEKRIRGQIFQSTLTDLITKEIELENTIDDLRSRGLGDKSISFDTRAELRQVRKEKEEIFKAINELGSNVEMGKVVGGRKELPTKTVNDKPVINPKDLDTIKEVKNIVEDIDYMMEDWKEFYTPEIINVEDIDDATEALRELQAESREGLSLLDKWRFFKMNPENKSAIDDLKNSIVDLNSLLEEGLQIRIKALDTEIEKQTRLYDESKTREQELIAIANEKNLNADESIKLERDKQKAALQEKQKLEAKQRQLEALIAFLNAYAAKIQAGEGNPVANIKKDILSAKSFVEGNFYKGTDTTIGDSLGYNGIKDGHIVAIDDNEAVLNPTLTREMGIGRGRTTQDVADIVKLFDITANKSMKVSDKSVNLTNGFDSKAIKLLEKLAQNTQPSAQPTGKNEFDVITGVLTYTANSKTKKETIKYKVRS